LFVDLLSKRRNEDPGAAIATGRGKFLGIVNDRLVGPIMSQIRHNLSPSKRAHVLGLTSRFEAAGGQLSGLLEIWWVALAHVAEALRIVGVSVTGPSL
jgi:hypothetical protein